MTTKIKLDFSGFTQLNATLRSMKAELMDRAIKDCMGRAVDVVLDEAKSNALGVDDPATGRKISDNIIKEFGSRVYRRTNKRVVMWRIGVRTRFSGIKKGNPDEGPGGNTPHWHMIELGTKRSKENPFLRKAMRDKREAFLSRFSEELAKRIRRLGRRATK